MFFFSLSCFPCDPQVLVLNLITLRPVVPSNKVCNVSPILSAVLSPPRDHHSSTGVQIPHGRKFESCEVWCTNWSTCANRTSHNLSLLREEVSQLRAVWGSPSECSPDTC